MDQVGIEPTSSRSTGEVTLSYTTSNSITVRRLSPGAVSTAAKSVLLNLAERNKTCRAAGAHPRILAREVSLHCAIPAFVPVGTSGSRFLSELLSLARQAVFETATSRLYGRALSWVEVTRTFTTPETFAAGIGGSSVLPLLCQLELQRLSSLAGLEPATAGEMELVPSPRRKLIGNYFLRCNLAFFVP